MKMLQLLNAPVLDLELNIAASMMIAAEELLLSENVTIFYGAHISGGKM